MFMFEGVDSHFYIFREVGWLLCHCNAGRAALDVLSRNWRSTVTTVSTQQSQDQPGRLKVANSLLARDVNSWTWEISMAFSFPLMLDWSWHLFHMIVWLSFMNSYKVTLTIPRIRVDFQRAKQIIRSYGKPHQASQSQMGIDVSCGRGLLMPCWAVVSLLLHTWCMIAIWDPCIPIAHIGYQKARRGNESRVTATCLQWTLVRLSMKSSPKQSVRWI